MAQVTIYIPDDLAVGLKERAKREGKSLSAYVAEIARREVAPDAWSDAFLRLYGSWEGDLEEPADPAPEPLDAF